MDQVLNQGDYGEKENGFLTENRSFRGLTLKFSLYPLTSRPCTIFCLYPYDIETS